MLRGLRPKVKQPRGSHWALYDYSRRQRPLADGWAGRCGRGGVTARSSSANPPLAPIAP
jgi:hypothetical protein